MKKKCCTIIALLKPTSISLLIHNGLADGAYCCIGLDKYLVVKKCYFRASNWDKDQNQKYTYTNKQLTLH